MKKMNSIPASPNILLSNNGVVTGTDQIMKASGQIASRVVLPRMHVHLIWL